MKQPLRLFVSLAILSCTIYSCQREISDSASNDSTSVKPSVLTTKISHITSTSAQGGGIVVSEGGEPLLSKGICWSKSQNPTISDSFVKDNNNVDTFTSSLTNLLVNTVYYVRAFATNSVGTSYGNQVSFSTESFSMDQPYGGGIVFYIDGTGRHGLIVSPVNMGVGQIQWWNGSYIAIGTGSAIGTGMANTNAIVAAQGSGIYAASLCKNYRGGGYDDWFLPSKAELNLLYGQNMTIGGFTKDFYWSSTEYTDHGYSAWSQNFYFGTQSPYFMSKNNTAYVRAVRAF